MSDTVEASPSHDERYLFDVHGCLLLRGVLSPSHCEALSTTLSALAETSVDDSVWQRRARADQAVLPTVERQPGDTTRLNGIMRLSPEFHGLIDHARILPYLHAFMGVPQLGNAWSIAKGRGNPAGQWHRGIPASSFSNANGTIVSRMLNVVFFLTDNGPDDGCMIAIPGSHKHASQPHFDRYADPRDVPGAQVITGKAGDVFLFSEAVLHNGLTKTSGGVRANLYYNYVTLDYNVLTHGSVSTRHLVYGPAVRDRFNPSQRELTRWMELVTCEDDPLERATELADPVARQLELSAARG